MTKELSKFEKFKAEYDADVEELPPAELEARLELVSGLGWRPGVNGNLPGVFPDKTMGNRCGWSVNWAMRGRVIRPEFTYRLEHMQFDQLVAEALDVAYRGQSPELAILLLQHFAGEDVNYGRWIIEIKDYLARARFRYPEYTAQWAIGPGDTQGVGAIMRIMPRPEYSNKLAILKALGVDGLGMRL